MLAILILRKLRDEGKSLNNAYKFLTSVRVFKQTCIVFFALHRKLVLYSNFPFSPTYFLQLDGNRARSFPEEIKKVWRYTGGNLAGKTIYKRRTAKLSIVATISKLVRRNNRTELASCCKSRVLCPLCGKRIAGDIILSCSAINKRDTRNVSVIGD